MASRVGPKGQVVIPKRMRDRLGIRPGDGVSFSLDGRSIRVEPVEDDVFRLRGAFRGSGLVEEYDREHELERNR